ncbi:MAG: Cof-type HAD-IIB family hydrolase [Bacteroidaceae bacterium]|nr:Cof-type HAD-IIB family hydrolase [Bacteroidaceae bacterium]
MKFKLLVLDVDGTLLNSKRELTKRTIATLVKVQQLGIRIALASGRPAHGILPLAKALGMDRQGGFIIAHNGAVVMDAASGEVIFERSIDQQMIPFMERLAKRAQMTLACYEGDEVISTDITDAHVVDEAHMNGMKLRQVESIADSLTTWPRELILVSDNEEHLTGVEEYLQKHMSGAMDTIHSNPYYLEIVGYQVGKSYAMSALVQKLGISLSDVLAIGDGTADVAMLQQAGTGIAMGNALEGVKHCADQITLTNDEDGAAIAIEKAIVEEVRKTEIPLDVLNAQSAGTMMGTLGIQYTFASPERVEATMPVDHRTRQPFGILAGGASLALAETLAGLGSMIACQPDEYVVGMQVSGNHVSSAMDGDTVRAVATPVHLGRSSHAWNVDIFTSTGKLVSSVRVLNSVLKKRG